MKKYDYTLFVLLVFISVFSVKTNAQQVNKDTFAINKYFQSNKEAAILLEKGVDLSITQTQNSKFFLNQVGYNNQINIISNAGNNQTVIQLGNNNEYKFVTYYNDAVSNLNIIQQGNSNSLQVYGENSLIKNLSIVQKTNFKTVIIRNN